MISRLNSATLVGIDGKIIDVEVYISRGLPSFSIVGLPDSSVKEARDRVVAALKNSGFDFPAKKITVNLAPADLRKEGGAFDLPIALGIIASAGKIPKENLKNFCFLGELALDGRLRRVKGALPVALSLAKNKIKKFIVPDENKYEASVVADIEIYPFGNLADVVSFLTGKEPMAPFAADIAPVKETVNEEYDLSDVKGQFFARRALEIAAAGGHNLLMSGPPGSGKTMLAKRLPSILPEMSFEEAVETTKIFSASGLTPTGSNLITKRPFRSPHHTVSAVALAGGGTYPKPWEISLSHNGVLFLDEFTEFRRDALEVLRQPLEDKVVTVSRAKHQITFPASFMLVAAMNPCPCGNLGHPEKECICNPLQITRYRGKISGPLMDRIDMHIEVPALKVAEITNSRAKAESSAAVKKRVLAARERQKERFTKIHCNAQMGAREIKKYCQMSSDGESMLKNAIERLGFSARAYDRIIKVAKTIADLEAIDIINASHIAEAVKYREFDKQ